MFDPAMPPILAELHAIELDYAEGDGIDLEPLRQFESASENADWLRSWLDSPTADNLAFRVFGHDGTGGTAAFWLVRSGGPTVLEQPIVFFGSEGELGVVARNFWDYLWLLAGGYGPKEAVEHGVGETKRLPFLKRLAAFATTHGGPKKTAKDVVVSARQEFPTFANDMRAQAGKGAVGERPPPISTRKERPEWDILLHRGLASQEAGRTDDALRDYARVIELAPWTPHPYINTGNIHWLRAGDPAPAIPWYDRALTVCPDHPIALRNRAEALLRGHRYLDAETDLVRVRKLDPNHPLTHFLFALRYGLPEAPGADEAQAIAYAKSGAKLDRKNLGGVDHPPYVALIKHLLKPRPR